MALHNKDNRRAKVPAGDERTPGIAGKGETGLVCRLVGLKHGKRHKEQEMPNLVHPRHGSDGPWVAASALSPSLEPFLIS
jgi:hypothetical protein